jgi:hypothetical protein
MKPAARKSIAVPWMKRLRIDENIVFLPDEVAPWFSGVTILLRALVENEPQKRAKNCGKYLCRFAGYSALRIFGEGLAVPICA